MIFAPGWLGTARMRMDAAPYLDSVVEGYSSIRGKKKRPEKLGPDV